MQQTILDLIRENPVMAALIAYLGYKYWKEQSDPLKKAMKAKTDIQAAKTEVDQKLTEAQRVKAELERT